MVFHGQGLEFLFEIGDRGQNCLELIRQVVSGNANGGGEISEGIFCGGFTF